MNLDNWVRSSLIQISENEIFLNDMIDMIAFDCDCDYKESFFSFFLSFFDILMLRFSYLLLFYKLYIYIFLYLYHIILYCII